MLQEFQEAARSLIQPTETVRDYLARIGTRYGISLSELASILEKHLYVGEGAVSADERRLFSELCARLSEAAGAQAREEAAVPPEPAVREEAEVPPGAPLTVERQPPPARRVVEVPEPTGALPVGTWETAAAAMRSASLRLLEDVRAAPARLAGGLRRRFLATGDWAVRVAKWRPSREQARDVARAFLEAVHRALAWRPSRAQALAWTALLAIFILLTTFNLRHLPSWYPPDSTDVFDELVKRYPDSLSSFSDPATSPEGLVRHRHGLIQFFPGLIAIPLIELFRLPLTDTSLEIVYIGLTTASIFVFYLLIRLTDVPRFVAVASALVAVILPHLIADIRQAGEAHVTLGIALSMLSVYAFYRYAERPTRRRSWLAGLVLGAYFMSHGAFPLVLPAIGYAMVAGKTGTIRERLLAAGRDALRPGLWLPALVAVGLQVYFWQSPPGDAWPSDNRYLGLLGYAGARLYGASASEFRVQFFWETLRSHLTVPLAVWILGAGLAGLVYVARMRREAIPLVLGWAYLGFQAVGEPGGGLNIAWSLYGAIPLTLFGVSAGWLVLKAVGTRFGKRRNPAAVAFVVFFLLVAISLARKSEIGASGVWSVAQGRETYNYDCFEVGLKATGAYLRTLPDEGGNVLALGYGHTAPLFYFPPRTERVALFKPQSDVSDIRPTLEPMVSQADTLVIADRIPFVYTDYVHTESYEPDDPFLLSAVVRDNKGKHYARIYRKDVTGDPVSWDLGEGEQLFDRMFHRLEDYRRPAIEWARGPEVAKVEARLDELVEEDWPGSVASEVGVNLHPNPSVETDLTRHGYAARASIERSSEWAAEGAYSVKVTITEATPYHQGMATTFRDAFEASTSTPYQVSVVARSGDGSGRLQLAVREFDAEGEQVNYSPSTAAEVGVEPRRLTRPFTSGPDTLRIGVEVRSGVDVELPVGFVFYYDEIAVRPADASRAAK